MNGSEETLSITAAAERLGVSRWTVWRMIAEGELDAESALRGKRIVTRVQLPQPSEDDPTPRSRTARLQERVDRLTHSIECLSEMLLQAERERAELRQELARRQAQPVPRPQPQPEPLPPGEPLTPTPRAEIVPSSGSTRDPQPAPSPQPRPGLAVPARSEKLVERPVSSITGRPNPMTHPAYLFLPTHGPAGEELLQPVRNLFKRDERRRSWWQKLPVARG